MQLYRRKSEDLQIEKLLAGSKRPHPLHDDYCSARAFAVNPSRLHQAQDQAAQGRDLSSLATLRASGVDCSARPSKESYHAMNADTCLVCSRPTSSDRKKAKKISLRRKISLTRRASYKPPALPGDTYFDAPAAASFCQGGNFQKFVCARIQKDCNGAGAPICLGW